MLAQRFRSYGYTWKGQCLWTEGFNKKPGIEVSTGVTFLKLIGIMKVKITKIITSCYHII